LPDAQKPRRFQRLWTLKEAYLKALGTGISGGLGSMTFRFEGDGVRFERQADAGAALWQFGEFEIDGEFLAAIACRPPAGTLGVTLRDYLPGNP
jgi:4'-phosphopantetheinyl transferase